LLTKLRRWCWTIPGLILSTAFFGTISQLILLVNRNSAPQYKCARAWAKSILLIAGVKIEIEGLERVRGIDQCVWASNHVTFMDTPVMLANIPVQFFFLAKSELFSWPFIGWHLTRAGHVPVPLDDPRASLRTLGHAARHIAESTVSLLFFPEGGRSTTGELQEFKDGAAYIAIKAQVPLVPVALVGIRDTWPMDTFDLKPGHVKLRFGTPISTSGLGAHARAEITTLCRAQIVDMLKR
jgi:1-acyl-sn-glycerol-3-phosphate acyltransferase